MIMENKTENIQYEYQVPFCRPFRCSPSTSNESKVLWDCVPDDCKKYITVLLAIIAMLAAMTITFNCLILGINLSAKTRRMRKRNPTMSNYSVYVVSLAVADLLVGVVVLPLCIANFYLEFLTDTLQSHVYMHNRIDLSTETDSDLPRILAVQSRKQKLTDGMDFTETTAGNGALEVPGYYDSSIGVRDALGVFTHLTLFVSIYTLITASADRFYAATYSTYGNQSQFFKSEGNYENAGCLRKSLYTVRRSTVAVFIVWILGIIFALSPLLLRNEFYFQHIGHIFSAMMSFKNKSTAVLWYLIMLVIPLVGMWILNVLICLTLWRRKRQLGQQRKRSLRRPNTRRQPSQNQNDALSSVRLASNSDSVFEQSVTEPKSANSQKYSASHWKGNNAFNSSHQKSLLRTFNRNQTSSSGTAGKGQGSLRSQSLPTYSKRSGLRRKVSSLRRAKELLKRQSYEANITKTLCIVVIAFTLAVLPLIVSLGRITLVENANKKIVNDEVTALTCSLLLLFSNSFINCVIYGARMRDFRTTLCQIFRNLFDKIENTFCCDRLRSSNRYSSEVVSGVFLVTKQHKSEAYQRSPRLGGIVNHSNRFRIFSGSSSIRSVNMPLTPDNVVVIKPESNLIEKTKFNDLVDVCKKNARPSSSGYRSDMELPSAHDDNTKNRYSQKYGEDQPKTEEMPLEILCDNDSITNPLQSKPQSFMEEVAKQSDDTGIAFQQITKDESVSENCTEQSFQTAKDNTEDQVCDTSIMSDACWETPCSNRSKASISENIEHSLDLNLDSSADFTLDIDFDNFIAS